MHFHANIVLTLKCKFRSETKLCTYTRENKHLTEHVTGGLHLTDSEPTTVCSVTPGHSVSTKNKSEYEPSVTTPGYRGTHAYLSAGTLHTLYIIAQSSKLHDIQ